MSTNATRRELEWVILDLGTAYKAALNLGANPQPSLDPEVFTMMAKLINLGHHIVYALNGAAMLAEERDMQMGPTDWLPYLGAFGISNFELLIAAHSHYTFNGVVDAYAGRILNDLKPWDFPGYEGWKPGDEVPEQSGK